MIFECIYWPQTIKQIIDFQNKYLFKLILNALKLIFLYLSWIQAAEAGWEREAFNGATEEENGERGTENGEKRAEDCCQAFITLIQHYRHSKQQQNNCSYYIWPGFVLPATLLSSPLWDIFLVHQPSWGFLDCWFLQVFFLYWTEHGTNNRPFCLFLSYCDCSYRALDERRKKMFFFLSVFITLEWFCQENCQLSNSVHFWFCFFFASHLFFFLNVLCLCFKHWTISIFQKSQINTTLGFCSQHSI